MAKLAIDLSTVDFIFDMVHERRTVSSTQVARAALALRGTQENYLRIEAWILKAGYGKEMSGLKVLYVPNENVANKGVPKCV